MAKNKKRAAFPTYQRPTMPTPKESFLADEPTGGVFGFFRDFGTRETIESILIAVILALMFRAFEAEAFIIPTGSMAPSLQGQHKDLECENCGYRYRAGASQDSADAVTATFCPICQYETKIRNSNPDQVTNSGDRILVNKFVYDFAEPQRYDVIVFKNPNNGKQNYIKRLIGLPGDNILIENGDIYLLTRDDKGEWERALSRKPPHKLKHVLQTVDDTDYIGEKLKAVNWPLRWQEFGGGKAWDRLDSNGKLGFVSVKAMQPSWLRYRHYRPYKFEWPTINDDRLPDRFANRKLPAGRLIGDNYAYNDELGTARNNPQAKDLGLHWVGDLGFECWGEVQSSSGKLLLDLVEGGAHFVCEIDVATGQATLRCDDPSVTFVDSSGKPIKNPTGATGLKGPRKFHLEYVNADDRIHLWIDGRLTEFDAATYLREGIAIPKYSAQDAGDAEPAGIAAENLDVRLTRLKMVRDLYYTSIKGVVMYSQQEIANLENETKSEDVGVIIKLLESPELWDTPGAIEFFKKKKGQRKPMFELTAGDNRDRHQFLPMGDNSPASLDGRVWDGPHYVERDMLIGRALFIYWPHTLNEPIKYFPNFGGMGFIR